MFKSWFDLVTLFYTTCHIINKSVDKISIIPIKINKNLQGLFAIIILFDTLSFVIIIVQVMVIYVYGSGEVITGKTTWGTNGIQNIKI